MNAEIFEVYRPHLKPLKCHSVFLVDCSRRKVYLTPSIVIFYVGHMYFSANSDIKVNILHIMKLVIR